MTKRPFARSIAETSISSRRVTSDSGTAFGSAVSARKSRSEIDPVFSLAAASVACSTSA